MLHFHYRHSMFFFFSTLYAVYVCIQHVFNLNTHAEIERSLKIITSAYIEAMWPMPSELRLFSCSVGAILFFTNFNDFFYKCDEFKKLF